MDTPHTRINSADTRRRLSPVQRARQVFGHRELVGNLIRRELKSRYKASVLGFVWTLLNPLMYLVVFSFVMGAVLDVRVPRFGLFMLCGLLVWNLFATGMTGGTTSIVQNASLVQKIWFPREVLPVASVGAALVHFGLQLVVLVAALSMFRHGAAWDHLGLLPLALVVLLLWTTVLAITFSAVNVYLRDTQHLIELALIAWFWFSAIVYQYNLVRDKIDDWLLLNPVVAPILAFQRVLYNPADGTDVLPDVGQWWYARNLLLVGAVGVAALYAALVLFGRLEDNLAEEI